ncbi:hypothetical protein [Paenibacillus sp. NAIST15-1]|uniref:hypothetical protein n=1 Tax=Paenibacillus sp. NAIST15-1 TaxID=1605994 RepID=UPI0008697DE4|nr:hypothetical protein [Paenibacillus sp. NAIST15-1]GAV12849.1 putative type III restriction enzyme, res subunit [Paenibacillus sp. NAIST15-1]
MKQLLNEATVKGKRAAGGLVGPHLENIEKIPKKQAVVGTLLAAASLAFFVIEALS